MNLINTKSALVIGAASLALFGWGCNPFQAAQEKIQQKVGQKVAEGILNQASGGKVDVNLDNGQVKVKDKATGGEYAYGENVTIPDDFPKDIPLYPGAKTLSYMASGSDQKGATVVLQTTDDTAKALEWYKGQMESNSWKAGDTMTISGTEFRSYTKDTNKINLTISGGQGNEAGKTTIMVNWTVEQAQQ